LSGLIVIYPHYIGGQSFGISILTAAALTAFLYSVVLPISFFLSKLLLFTLII